MTLDQTIVLAIGVMTILMFLWGRWRHDVIAVGALLVCVLAGVVPSATAFAGFGHPAVITVACVLILSQGLQLTGAVDSLAQRVLSIAMGPALSIAMITGFGALLSAFMNNVGAMALLMPIAVQLAEKKGLPPGRVLMPLSFGTILGGMTTLIGTPPNLIVAGFRSEAGAGSFAMFDFTPVGSVVAVCGIGFIALLGWRLVPARSKGGSADFDTGSYLTEARVSEDGKAVGMSLREIEQALEEVDAQIIGMARNAFLVSAPNPGRVLRAGDILVIEADPHVLETVLSNLGLELKVVTTAAVNLSEVTAD
ncbi:MAG: SLC13 family permease, partial [Desulfuromonadaceae bacterium]